MRGRAAAGKRHSGKGSFLEVLTVFTRLGLTSFGGPTAHLGYFHAELITRRKWLSEQEYADLIALCQFLPGPASSQVGIGLGHRRAGIAGALAAWLGFTLPSALVLVIFALLMTGTGDIGSARWLPGLKIVAVPVVAHAIRGMAGKLTPDRLRLTLALIAAAVALLLPGTGGQLGVIIAGALFGLLLLRDYSAVSQARSETRLSRRWGALLMVFAALLLGLPVLRQATESQGVAVADSFYRTGSLVFGGGHVVLPLLQAEVVPTGWLDDETFIVGYGAAQAVPGPLFTVAAYLGAAMAPGVTGVWLGTLALIAIFVPSFLLLLGVLPFWDRLRGQPLVQAALRGVNAAVVGLLLAALYDPVWTSAILGPVEFALALVGFLLLAVWRWPAWLVVILSAGATALLFS